MRALRDELHTLADRLPADATWEDAMYALCIRQRIDPGERAIAEGRFVSQQQLEQQIGEWHDK